MLVTGKVAPKATPVVARDRIAAAIVILVAADTAHMTTAVARMAATAAIATVATIIIDACG